MGIGRYSVVKLLSEDCIIQETMLPENLKTEELIEIENQLKIIHKVYAAEIRRRAYDLERQKSKSKFWGDDFSQKLK